ncbi:DUF1972 domain-containing protein [Pseudomonas putida]|nr:DUF1972 domain-containing protein [Pseudomonas putida]
MVSSFTGKKLYILGTRGVPAQHGGFETFAEKLSLYLVSRGWEVTVYCQEEKGKGIWKSDWCGISRIHIPVSRQGALGTIIFDWRATWHALSQQGLFLTLGYNTAIFNVMQRLKGQVNIINMDGIEWRREKWGGLAKTWFWVNERIGCWVGNHLIADHPDIKSHLATRVNHKKITMIPYGGDEVRQAEEKILSQFGVVAGEFSIVIARPEPENSFLEMIKAFSAKKRNHKLVVLGNFIPETNSYHKQVIDAASDEVIFPGAIYDSEIVRSLRYFSRFYLHGHRVGGTNPSLVEALGAGCAVLAHENCFNKWVAGADARYFATEAECSALFDQILQDDDAVLLMKQSSIKRFTERFTWAQILREYEQLLLSWHSVK